MRCVGEEKPSNKAKIYLSLGVNKMALASVMYDFNLELTNPLSVTSDAKKWQLITYAPGAAGEEATRRYWSLITDNLNVYHAKFSLASNTQQTHIKI